MELMGVQEIGDLFGVSRTRTQQLVKMDDFPRPLAELAQGRVWDGKAVRAWGRSKGRTVDDESPR